MATLTERQISLLNTIVKEYVDSANPVSSHLIEKRYDFEVSPATIRNDMQRLTEQGFLFQPHTSAGRVPTDRGYRLFVDNLLQEEIAESANFIKIQSILENEKENMLQLVSTLSRFLGESSSNLAVIHFLGKDFSWKDGWAKILKEPEFEKKDFVVNFTKLLDRFEKEIDSIDMDSELKVFIGRENPFFRTKDFSIISTRCSFPGQQEGIVSLLGPTRMYYDKNISLISSLVKMLQDL
jgi:heat-inducible transcriptional repressor